MMTPAQGGSCIGLARLLEGIASAPEELTVTDITLDSRGVAPGAAFFACRGIRSHGLAYLDRALAGGAAAVVWEPAPGISAPRLPTAVFGCAVPALSRQLGRIADRFFGAPSARVRIAGITGTNGKTTTAWLLAQALQSAGRRGGYTGTLGCGPIGAFTQRVSPTHTTPDVIALHRQVRDLHTAGVRTLTMEVSSHALEQERIDGIRIDTAAFTNLSRDHLDYHKTMEAYGEAKARLFALPGLARRVINVGDPFGRRLAERLPDTAPVTAVWVGAGAHNESADSFVQARSVLPAGTGLEVELDTSWGAGTLRSPLIGEFNAENLMVAVAVLLLWEIPLPRALAALGGATAPPGRLETFGGEGRPLAVVDYAHSPDALAKVLRAVRRHARGRVWCVFGCGGDRDRGKRPIMGTVAAELADEIVLTDDNPRTEDPERIVREIAAGICADRRCQIVRDRARAIAAALGSARDGDVVLIAGKGHEEYQIYGDEAQPFSDRDEVRRWLGGAP